MADGNGQLVPVQIHNRTSYVIHLASFSARPSVRMANKQRIFNTITQSEKCDPSGDYIRYWVPELKNLKGKAIHDPYHNMPKNEFKKLGYPEPIVDHKTARLRALFRYKNVGEKEEGA
jgi:deoxyribodipyrimidine photolyase